MAYTKATDIAAVACPDGKEKRSGSVTSTVEPTPRDGRGRPTVRFTSWTTRCDTTSVTSARSPLLPVGTVRLVIAGGGPDEAALRAAAPPDVTFLGVLDHKRALPELYASADAFVFASLTETLGLVVLEAMASGLPVIATPAGGVADHLRDGENGLAFPANAADRMAHAMVRLAMDYKLRDQLASGARRSAEALDWEGALDRLGASYREVCLAHANSTATILHRQVGSLRTSVG